MKMKNKIVWTGFLSVLLCWACVDDTGNYTYEDPETLMPVEISGLSDTTFKILETVSLTPEIKGMQNESDYWFTWYSYPAGSTGTSERDTLARTRNLTFKMEYPAGESRILVYEIKDKKTGVHVNSKIRIQGISEYGKGFIVLKDENEETDIDFVFPDGSKHENILYTNLQTRLQGTAVKVVFQEAQYANETTNPDGTVTLTRNQQAWHVLSSRDMISLKPDNLSIYKRAAEEFYSAPEAIAPQDLFCHSSQNHLTLINAGKIHTISNSTQNIGKFGYSKFGYENLFPAMVNTWSYTMAFDRTTRSFVMTSISQTDLQLYLPPKAENPLQISSSNMNADMIALLQRGLPGNQKAWALMKSVSGPEEYYLIDIKSTDQNYPFTDYDVIPASRNLVHADVYAAHELNYIWFAKDNVLSYYQKNTSDADSYETTESLYPFPAGEKITWMQQIISLPWADEEDAYNYLLVITNSSNGWKLYRFELEQNGLTANLKPNAEPAVYSGTGFARYALWVNEEN